LLIPTFITYPTTRKNELTMVLVVLI